MPFYHKLGNIPQKRHTQFEKPGGGFYYEQLFGTIGFDGMSTNSYHEQRPTQVKSIGDRYSIAPKIAETNNIQSYRLRGFEVSPKNDFLEGHCPLPAPDTLWESEISKNQVFSFFSIWSPKVSGRFLWVRKHIYALFQSQKVNKSEHFNTFQA